MNASGEYAALRERLERQAKACSDLAATARMNDDGPREVARLRGKAEGIRIAISDLDEMFSE